MIHEGGGTHRKCAFQWGYKHLEAPDGRKWWGAVGVDKHVCAHITDVVAGAGVLRAGVAESHNQPLRFWQRGFIGGGGCVE